LKVRRREEVEEVEDVEEVEEVEKEAVRPEPERGGGLLRQGY
jgi:hypothetical protein